MPPPVVGASLKALELASGSNELRDKLAANAARFRSQMEEAGFTLNPGCHPIIPVMLVDAVIAQKMADILLHEGVYAIGFFYPVVPKGKARIRVQLSAAHSFEDIDRAVAAFKTATKELGL